MLAESVVTRAKQQAEYNQQQTLRACGNGRWKLACFHHVLNYLPGMLEWEIFCGIVVK